MDPPVRMGVVVTSILHESIHGLLYFYLSHFILQSVINIIKLIIFSFRKQQHVRTPGA